MDCQLDHIVLNVENDETMLAFYVEVLQLTSERLEDYRAGQVPFASVRLNRDSIIDLFPKPMWQQSLGQKPGRLNHFCLVVSAADWQQLVLRLEEHEIPIEEGPVSRWGAHGSGISIYFRDPENNLIEARYYEPGSEQHNCLLSS